MAVLMTADAVVTYSNTIAATSKQVCNVLVMSWAVAQQVPWQNDAETAVAHLAQFFPEYGTAALVGLLKVRNYLGV